MLPKGAVSPPPRVRARVVHVAVQTFVMPAGSESWSGHICFPGDGAGTRTWAAIAASDMGVDIVACKLGALFGKRDVSGQT